MQGDRKNVGNVLYLSNLNFQAKKNININIVKYTIRDKHNTQLKKQKKYVI